MSNTSSVSPAEPRTTVAKVQGSFVMPFSNVRHLKFVDKVRAAQLAGFRELTVQPHEARRVIQSGITATDMMRIAGDHDVRIVRVDPLTNWNPVWLPTNMDANYIEEFDISDREFFDICAALKCRYASLNASFAKGLVSFDQGVEFFAKCCEMAAEYSVTCDLENLPMWGVDTLQLAWDIVRESGAANAGIVFDTLHFMRSDPDLSVLESIPGHRIHTVQVNDGPKKLLDGVTLEENCFDRLWPGEGEFPLVSMLEVLARTGGLNQVAPEVFSPGNAGKSAEEIAKLSGQSIRLLLDKAGIAYD
jgi:sugar phosphate isomerase/epimerase